MTRRTHEGSGHESTRSENSPDDFGRVVDGMPVVEAIEASPRTGETPTARIELKAVRIEPR